MSRSEGQAFGHRCNVLCDGNKHAEVLYNEPGTRWLRPGEEGPLRPYGRVRILSVEEAREAQPHPHEFPSYTEKRLYVFEILEED